jgi:GT2 family glycosyltransferase
MSATIPLSVIVSVRNSELTLREVLAAIRASELFRDSYELIVVDDASTDCSVLIAARYADVVIRLNGHPSGPAYTRNRGVETSRGEVIAFVDGDILVRRDTLPRMLAMLAEGSGVDAVSASHDDESGAPNFASQYWNLLVCFGEQRYAGESAQFAPGCGAVRRSAFLAAGMYDEWRFVTGCLESVELGERMLRAGKDVVQVSDLRVMHLRRRDIRSVCHDVWARGGHLARSLGYFHMSAAAPSEVVFTLTRALTPAIALIATLILAAAFVPPPSVEVKIGVAVLTVLLTDLPLHRFYAKARGFRFALLSAPLHILVQLVAGVALCRGWILRYVSGDVSPDARTQAYSEVGLDTWPPVPRRL